MKSLKELFRIGHGPSSSHTMAPARAAELFGKKAPAAARYEVTLFGSLAATGKGHFTDRAISDVLGPDRTAELERIALDLPLSRQRRPEWDAQVLESLGIRVAEIAERVGARVQDPVEFERDEPTPMFMVCGEKE